MDLTLIAFAVLPIGGFVAGVIFHKYVISEATALKEHVTGEVAAVRADVASLLSKVAAKL
jgi:hypothetical protein